MMLMLMGSIDVDVCCDGDGVVGGDVDDDVAFRSDPDDDHDCSVIINHFSRVNHRSRSSQI